MLQGVPDLPQELLVRALAARVAGLILTNDPAQAQRETVRYRGRLGNSASTQAVFRFLLGQAEQGPRALPGSPAPR